ncbi:hypothetical protein D3C76_1863750 [compost metagenome]
MQLGTVYRIGTGGREFAGRDVGDLVDHGTVMAGAVGTGAAVGSGIPLQSIFL